MKYSIESILRIFNIEYIKNYRIPIEKEWCFDFAILDKKIGIVKDKKSRSKKKECELNNEAQKLGWIILRYTNEMIQKRPEKIVQDIWAITDRRNKNIA